jgi:hypothetical protein
MRTTFASMHLQPIVLHFTPILQKVSDREFFEFCQGNPDWQLEFTSETLAINVRCCCGGNV